jgi:hypothetical protein
MSLVGEIYSTFFQCPTCEHRFHGWYWDDDARMCKDCAKWVVK